MNPALPLPADLWRNEESLRRAAELIELSAGRVRAVSFDFFDTLVWRLTTRPTDVFPEIGRRLKEQQLIPAHVTPADFATLRRVAEGKARQAQHSRDKAVEDVRLDAVYAQMRTLVKDGALAAQFEVAAEADLCVLNPSVLAFARHVRERGLRTVIISDIYLAADALREILRANHCDPGFFEHIFTSSDCGVCKGTGNLFRAALKTLRLKPEELLHLGDNPGADVAGARKAGLRACQYAQGTPAAQTVLAREAALLGGSEPAFSINSLRLLAARQFPGETAEAFFARSGALLLGPLLSRFATWACEQFTASGVRKVGAFMREGDLFGQLLQAEANHQGLPLTIAPLFVNRKSTDLAAIGRLSAENLLDWLGRRETLPVKTILKHFGLGAEHLRGLPFSADERVNGPDRLHQLAKHLFTPEIAQRIEARSAEERRKVVDYLRPWLESGAAFGVCDIGYNASAQMQLARILEMEGIRVPMVGCYLVTCERAASRVLDGLDVRHFLGSFGKPDFHFASFIRSPAFVEQCLTAPIGTTLGYQRQPDGSVTPVLDGMRFAPELLRRQRAFKDGVLAFQKLWLWTRAQKPASLAGDSALGARVLTDIDRAGAMILGRASAFPLQAELRHFATIPLDDYYFAEGVKTICATSDREQWRKGGYARLLAAQGVLWPQAVHQLESPKATDDFFSYSRAMLLSGAGEVAEGVPPEITVIVQAGNDLARFEECLTRLKENAAPGRGIEVVAIVAKITDELKTLTLRHTNNVFRAWAVQRQSADSLSQCLNSQADRSPSFALLFTDDGVRARRGWDEQVLASLRNPTTALLFPSGATNDAAESLPQALGRAARCVAIRRSAFIEGLGLSSDLSPAGALWHLAAQLRELNWQARVATPAFADLTGGDSSLPASDLRNLERTHASFAAWAKNLLGSPAVSTPAGEAAPATAAGKPMASVIILAFNQLEHTRRCLESLAAHTPLPHEIIVVDNGSNDGTPEFLREWLAKTPHGVVIRNETNLGFAAGNNQGLALARGQNMVLLNNDTVVTAGWLEGMLGVLEREPDTGVVGPMSNRVSGPQFVSEVGYTDWSGLPAFAKQWTQTHAGQSFEVGRAVGFCLLARRDVIERIGGLDERFGSGNFEDDDFCIRARLAGFRIRIAKDVFIHHTGSQTFKGAKIDYRSAMLRNWDLFRAKWQLPAGVALEKGYPIPQQLPAGVPLNIPLSALTLTHKGNSERFWQPVAASVSSRVVTGESPLSRAGAGVAKLGQLDEARGAFGRREFAAAWQAACTALHIRPFHPEACLLLAEIALAAGDAASARSCAQHAAVLAPRWNAPKQFLKKPLKGGAKPEWLALPEQIRNPKSEIRSRLTVGVLTRNEEQFITQCLNSVKGLADQIIVVDTGSTDRTIEIAKSLGAEVYTTTWNDDFSAPRNRILEHATGDWILMLDADEELPADQHAALRADLRKADAIAFRLPLVNRGQEAEGRSFIPRLFRNAPGAYYYGRIHEQVFPSLLPLCKTFGMDTALGTACLLHHGYSKELVRDRNKIERNLRLLRLGLEERPTDINLTLNLGLELVRSGEVEPGIAKYRDAFRLMSAQKPNEVVPELREVLLTQFTSHLYKIRAHDEVVQVLNSSLARSGGGLTASMYFALGLSHYELKQYREAAEQMRQCLAKLKQPALSPINTDILSAAPHHCLALSLAKLNDAAGAEKAFQAGLASAAKTEDLRVDYARFLVAQGRPVEALQRLHEVVQQNAKHALAWRLGGEIALSQPAFLEFARDWTNEAVRLFPDDLALVGQRAEALLLSQQARQAQPLWERACNGARPPRAVAAAILCATLEAQPGMCPQSAAEELNVSRAFVDWYRRLVAYRAVETVVQLNSRVGMLRETLPGAARVIESVAAAANAAEPG